MHDSLEGNLLDFLIKNEVTKKEEICTPTKTIKKSSVKKTKKKRCNNCRSKLKLVSTFLCQHCNLNYCPTCRHQEEHNCSGLEIKKNKQIEQLKKENTYAGFSKIIKI